MTTQACLLPLNHFKDQLRSTFFLALFEIPSRFQMSGDINEMEATINHVVDHKGVRNEPKAVCRHGGGGGLFIFARIG
jgi:hypothetical protein